MSSNLLTENLFQQVLLKPAQEGANEIFIVSGYASSAMAFHHAQELKNQNIRINLIIGMTSRDGLSRTNHQGFKSLMTNALDGSFNCSYVIDRPPIHSKVYSWTQIGKPLVGFTGSANYSQQAFISRKQGEVVAQCNPDMAYEYYQSLISDSIFCTHQDADFVIDNYRDYRPVSEVVIDDEPNYQPENRLDYVTVSLINRYNTISQRSGLNWGQREGRERNQAYIPLKTDVYRSDFFPPIGQHFTVNTDDRKILLCSRAQENGKAIHTPHNNSLLGEYFRNRLGLANGTLVTMEHLTNYGRTNVTFHKVDEENYYMDFSV